MDNAPTLASKLGMTEHISPILQKAAKLGLDAKGLERLAIQRGCYYYSSPDPAEFADVPESSFSNEELAIALLNPSLRYDLQTIRLGAAMLSAEGNSVPTLAQLANSERCEQLVRYIAESGHKFEPDNAY